ncbi:hypothetical protein KY495_17955 [Massilia sp. PAMC28688]|uniref:DUF5985 family protein n=1 Tax=Massilia sp. PAMC28688 TaxID=2861283 RepID=UPI001C63061C|nr:DUF5985 family protein [Massilia sp. PAMC28688]QYF92607.1 hypothetical protein KY495_17955 [Massilia sp. PAMC28688]
MAELLSGAITIASLVIALFFLRFWRDSGDRFFLYFALSFAVQAGHRMYAAILWVDVHEDEPFHYLIRLLSYALILWAILEKNLPRKRLPNRAQAPKGDAPPDRQG